jgi:hypothetical protein
MTKGELSLLLWTSASSAILCFYNMTKIGIIASKGARACMAYEHLDILDSTLGLVFLIGGAFFTLMFFQVLSKWAKQ